MEKQGLKEIEELIKKIEGEENFENIVEFFAKAAVMVKSNLDTAGVAKGKITQIIRELDEYIEKEFKC